MFTPILRACTTKPEKKYFDTYIFQLGDFSVISLMDGLWTSNCDEIYKNAPSDELDALLNRYDLRIDGTVTRPFTAVYVDTGKNKVLLDTGMMLRFAGPPADAGHLLENLRYEDIKPAEVDTVIISHAHPDHIGGIVDIRTGGPAFPNAQHYMWKDEYQFWMEDDATKLSELRKTLGPSASEMLQYARDCINTIKDQLVLIDNEKTEIAPGFKYINAYGHTPYQMAVIVSSNNQQLFYSADVFHYEFDLERPDWYNGIDMNDEQAVDSRIRLAEWAAKLNILVKAAHTIFPGLGYIIKKGDAFQWAPCAP